MGDEYEKLRETNPAFYFPNKLGNKLGLLSLLLGSDDDIQADNLSGALPEISQLITECRELSANIADAILSRDIKTALYLVENALGQRETLVEFLLARGDAEEAAKTVRRSLMDASSAAGRTLDYLSARCLTAADEVARCAPPESTPATFSPAADAALSKDPIRRFVLAMLHLGATTRIQMQTQSAIIAKGSFGGRQSYKAYFAEMKAAGLTDGTKRGQWLTALGVKAGKWLENQSPT